MDVNQNVRIVGSIVTGLVNTNKKDILLYQVTTRDVLFTRTSETIDEIGLTSYLSENIENCVFSGFLLKASPKSYLQLSSYIAFQFRSNPYRKKIQRVATITSRALINSDNLSKIEVFIPSRKEQEKITKFLLLLYKKIELLECKISILKKYKKGLIIYLLSNGIKTEKFANYIEYISKTSFPSSDGKEKGKYPFYINSTDGNHKFTDFYSHEGKYLIVNTGGQAFIQISEEKFSAMADNLIIKIRKNLYGVYYYLKGIESRINYIGFQGTGIRHLDQNWLKRQYVILPSISDKKIEALEENINNYIKVLEIKLKKLHLIKMQLMKDLFI